MPGKNRLLLIALAAALVIAAPVALIAQEAGETPPDKPAAEKPPDKEVVKKFHADMKAADEPGKIALIEGMLKSEVEPPEKAKAIGKYMTDRRTSVKKAALKAMGELKDPKFMSKLMGMVKASEKEPEILAAVIDALGQYGDKKTEKTLMDVAKKWIRKDKEVFAAAALGLGNIKDRKAIEDLIKLLGLTYVTGGGSGGTTSDATVAHLKACRPFVITALQNLTGWDFEDAEAWTNFWEGESRRWKPPEGPIDATELKTWRDPGYGFSIDRVGKWVFNRADKYKAYRIYMERITEGVTEGYIYVSAYKTRGKSSEQLAKEYEDSYAPGSDSGNAWKDIKPDSIVREDIKLGKTKGFKNYWVGRDTYGQVARMSHYFFVHDGFTFIIGSWRRSGPEGVEEDVAKLFDSFKFLYAK